MNRIFLLLVVTAVLISCDNTSSTEPERITPDKKDSLPLENERNIQEAFSLSPLEMQDDSVFADGSQPVAWANAGIDHPIAFKQFIKRVQYWVQHDQKDSVAAVIAFPLKHPPVKNKASFLANYDTYFNAKVKSALAAQNLRQIFRNSQGAMIGDGELWFKESSNGFSIISINY